MAAFAQLALPGVLLAILSIAVWHDVAEHRIPNPLVAAALAGGLALQFLSSGPMGLAHAAGGAAVGLVALLPFHLLKGMGAGDVKLMAAVGAFLGPAGAVFAAAVTLVLGATLAICVVLVSRRTPTAAATSVLQRRFPYAMAIAGGTLYVMWQQDQLSTIAATLGA